MKEALLNTIHDIYLGHNYQLFRSKCMNTPYYITELLNTSKSLCEDVTISHFVDWPSIELFCKFSSYKKDLFSVDYTTIIKISKIIIIIIILYCYCEYKNFYFNLLII